MSDIELIDFLATKAMGWTIHRTSAHRPGDRDYPHGWRWVRGRQNDLMIYDGRANRRFDPIAIAGDAQDLKAKLADKGILPAGGDAISDDAGRRAFCLAAAEALTPTGAQSE